MKKHTKMTAAELARRKRSRITNAANRVMGGSYSN